MPLPAALLLSLISLASAATVTYDFEIGWVTANPDGQANRPVIGINGQWPIPRIECEVGDRIIVNVLNSLGNQTTSLHFHGLYMTNATHMDGPIQVSQCPIPPGSRFTYNFTVSRAFLFSFLSQGLQTAMESNSWNRSTNREHTGTTLTTRDNTPTGSGAL